MRIVKYFDIPRKATLLPCYPISAATSNPQKNMDRPEGLGTYCWLQTIKGEGFLTCAGKKVKIGENQGFIMNKTDPHQYEKAQDCPEWITQWIQFDGDQVEKILAYGDISFFTPYTLIDPSQINTLVDQLIKIPTENPEKAMFHGSSLLYRFFAGTADSFLSEGSRLFANFGRIEPVIIYINKNYPRPIPLDVLAECIHITPQHLCVLFKGITGQRPSEYINGVRINRSRELLLSTDFSIREIFLRCGYTSGPYFFKLFKEHEHCTPNDFRRKMKHR